MELLNLIGRFHPVVLHLPIGFLLLAFLMELTRKEGFRKAVGFALQWGMVAAIVSAITGWLLSGEGDYEEKVLFWHRWLGTGTAALSVLLFLLQRRKQGRTVTAYFPVMVATVAMLLVAGHFGGTLTHGSGFLLGTNLDDAAPVPITNLDSAVVFQDIILPVLNDKCTGCHNKSKLKGKLLMTGKEGLVKGGKSGPLFVAGDTVNSLLLQRLHLPIAEKKHMPPKGKKQPSKEEIRLLSWWIAQGADFEKTVAQMETPPAIRSVLEKYGSPVKAEGVLALNVAPASERELDQVKKAGIKVSPLALGSPWLEASLAGQKGIDKKMLKALKAISEQLVSLDLSRTGANDDMLRLVADFPHLQKLSLQKTAITDEGLRHLNKLAYLQHLNLYGTAISEKALPHLAALQRLKNLYLWQTNFGKTAIAKLQQEKPHLQIDLGTDPEIFEAAQLLPPSIVAEKDIFNDTMTVALTADFKGIDIYYTLDGKEPDSTSLFYEKPFLLNSSTEVRAIALKTGWIGSETARRFFAKAGYTIKEVVLSPKPEGRYKGEGGKNLSDFVKGTINFGKGGWLGYQGKHVTATLDLGDKEQVKRVTVSALEAPDPWIFFPKRMEVSVSTDGKNYKAVAKESYPTAVGPRPPETANFFLDFEPTTARYIRVKVTSNLKNPSWHPAPGQPCWVFLDEIMVE